MDFNVSSDWKQAFNGEIIITNISEQTIEDWSLEFDFDKNISSFWTADIVSHEGNHYSIVNKGYNANIAPGASVSLGFRGEPGGVDNSPNNYILQKYHIADANQKAAAIHRKMAEEELANWVVPTLLELEGEFRSLYQTAQRFYREGLSFEREEQYKLAKDKYQLSWQTLYNKRKELNDINDIISYIMANPDDDHDGDGLLNGFETEAFYGCMNPMKADSDDNGINDGDEDYDLDGLSNLDEQKYGTSPIDSDTDNDGINDKREIELGLNPLDPNDNQTKKEQLIISNETGIEIKINAMGNAEDKVRVAESQTVVESVYAVSPFYDISTEIDFESAEIKIPIDLSSIPEEDYDKLWIVYFDEELGGFIPIENSTVDPENSCVSAVTNHFSLYSIFYIKNWDTYFSVPFNEAKRITEEHINLLDVMFIIDSSGSMDWNDPNDYRKQAAKNFVDALLPGDQIGLIVGDRAGVVDFDSYAYLLQGLTDDFEAVKDAIDDIDSSGGTNIGNGVNLANDELIAKSDEDRIKVEILLTDGEGSYSTSYTNEAIQNDITIYTIGLGNSVNSALLRQIAENTGGQYFHVNSADELPIVYDRIYEITTEPQDSDGDGIPDSLEIEGIKVGSILGRLIYTDPNNPDSDGDGLLDGEEIEVKNAHTVTILGIEFKWYKMLSDPNKMDTDNDNLNDYQETTEYKTNPMQKDSDNDKLDDYTETIIAKSNPLVVDTDGDTIPDYDEFNNDLYDPCNFDKVIKSNGKYVVNDNDRWHGRVHIQSPVIISHQASLEISDIYKIFIENITKTTHWEDEIISVYGELLAVDESLKAIEYEGSSDWVGICLRDKGKAQLNNFNIQGMVLGVSVGEGSELTFSDSKIDRCYQGVSTFYGENDGTVVKISNTDFNFNEDYWTKSYPAISIYGNTQFSYNGGNINNFETGVLLNYNQEESVINNVNINKAGTAIDIDDASTKIENVKLEDNYCGIFATKLWALNNENIMNIDIKNCIITDNEKGIHAERFKTKINLTDTIISNSGTYGIQVQKEATVLVGENVDFENNATDVTSNVLSDILQSLAIDLIPYVGDAKGILEAFRGRDLISDSQLSSIEKGLAFLCLAEVKSVKKTLGKLDELIALRKLKNITKLADAKFIETAKFLLTNYGDEVFPHIEKYLDDFVEVFIKHGDKAVQLAVKYGDDAAGYISKYSKEAIDLIDKLGPDAIEAYKNVEKVLAKYSKLDDIGKFINESNTLAIELGRTGKKTFTSSNYADALKALYSGIAKKLSDFNAHHIFPQALFGPNKRYERYLRYQNRLININDSRLLVWWEAAEHGQKAYEYSQKWIKFFAENSNATIDEVIEFARTLAKEYGFNVKF